MNDGIFVNNEENTESEIPSKTSLSQNYPNPFNPVTVIQFSLEQPGVAKLKVFDLQGRLISEITNSVKSAGTHQVRWDASNFASGVYFYQLETASTTITRKLTLIK